MSDLIEKCKKNNSEAQMLLYKQYCNQVYNSCFRILLKTDEAEDAMQETFIKAFKNLDSIGTAPLEAWLRRIAINTSLDALKSIKVDFTELDSRMPIEEEKYDEEDIVFKADQVKKAINSMPHNYRIILSLTLIEGYDYEEISSILKIKEGAARTQFVRAKQKLIELLKSKDYAIG